MAFKTMLAVCVEVGPVLREGGRSSHCNAALMTGIQGQCQVQVEMRGMVGDGAGMGTSIS